MNKILKVVRKSLSLKLGLIISTGTIFIMLLVLVTQGIIVNNSLLERQHDKIESMGKLIAAASLDDMMRFDYETVNKYSVEIMKDQDVYDVVFLNYEGKRVNDMISVDTLANYGKVYGIGNISKSDSTSYEFPIEMQGFNAGKLIIKVHDQYSNASINALQWKILAIFIFGISAIALIGWLTNRRYVIKPINELKDVMSNFSPYLTEVKFKKKKSDEIGDLQYSFEQMAFNIHNINRELVDEKESISKKVEEATSIIEKRKQYLSDSIDKILTAMEKFAEGDLTVSVEVNDEDETIKRLFEGLNKSIANIRQMLKSVYDSAKLTVEVSDSINSGSEEIAAGVFEQSNQTYEIAREVEKLTNAIVENTNSTKSVAKCSIDAELIAKRGTELIHSSIESMKNVAENVKGTSFVISTLTKSAQQINAMSEVIDEIASQTNLLALNAAIEAARAGEHGRGFAIVADEVRKLAERTVKATKEIDKTINGIQASVASADDSMKNVVSAVENNMELTNELSFL